MLIEGAPRNGRGAWSRLDLDQAGPVPSAPKCWAGLKCGRRGSGVETQAPPPRPGVFGRGGLSLLGPRSPLPENGPDDPCFASRGNDRTLPSRRWRCRPGDEVTCRATGLAGRDPRISLALHWVLGPHPVLSSAGPTPSRRAELLEAFLLCWPNAGRPAACLPTAFPL